MTSSLAIIIAGLLVIFLAGVTFGLAGFGFTTVSVPIMIIFLPPQVVVPIAVIHGILICIFVLAEARKWVDLKRIWSLIIAGLAGIPFGIYLLVVLDVTMLKVFIGTAITVFGVALLAGFKRKIKNEKLAFAPVGFVSGLLTGSMGTSAPPVTLFLTNQGVKRQVFRANLALYLMVVALATIPGFIISGLVTKEVLGYVILFLPAMIVGVLIGIKLVDRVREELFKKIVLAILIFAGLLSITSGLGLL